MNLIFGLEHTENRNGVLFESWFNGWPLPSDEKFQRIVEDNARYNSDLFGQGCDEEGMRAWLKFYPCPVAGFLPENHLLKYTTKNINDILPEEKYIYPILLHGGGMLNYTSFQEYGFTISERVLNDCRAGKCKILLHELNEGHGFNLGELKKFIENQLTKLNIPASSFGFLDGNYKTPELQRQYGTKGFCVFHWENHSRMLSYDEEVKRIQEIKNLKFKPYHFISLNRRPREHRIPLVMYFDVITCLRPKLSAIHVSRIKVFAVSPIGSDLLRPLVISAPKEDERHLNCFISSFLVQLLIQLFQNHWHVSRRFHPP